MDYDIGYKSSELGKYFCERLTSGGIVDNCHLAQFRFIYLSFMNYIYLVQSENPTKNINEMLQKEFATLEKGMEYIIYSY